MTNSRGLVLLGASLALSLSTPLWAMSKKPTPTPTPVVKNTMDPNSIWVGKSDEAKSCAKEKGIETDHMAHDLEAKGIKVLAKKKVSDGKMRIMTCGADKGDMNGFLISKKDLEAAEQMGFLRVPAPLY